MKYEWKKLGRIYNPDSTHRHPKLLSHAANPLPIHLENDVYRIYYSGRDHQNRSSVGAIDFDIVRRIVVRDFQEPFFQHGPKGSFYADGVSIGNCYIVNGVQYMLFMGWQTPKGRHWHGVIGRLVVNNDLSLQLESQSPFISLDKEDPISLSYPWVLDSGFGGYFMWYGSTKLWDAGNGEMLHVINYAFSADGNVWHRHGLSVPYEIGVAQAFSRPSVVRDSQGIFHMWFSYRGGPPEMYRIGYARSINGKNWELDLDNSGITVSATGWDSDMVEYPFVFSHAGNVYLLYNGNNYGKSGFGLAIREKVK